MKKILILIGLILLPFAMCGCGGDDGGSSGPAEGVNVTGTWNGISSDQVSFTANFTQQPDGALAGSVRRQDGYTGSVSGQVSGYNLDMHVIWNYGGSGNYEGNIVGNSIEGTFDEQVGTTKMTGTFSAFKQ